MFDDRAERIGREETSSAPTMRIVPINSTTKVGEYVVNVPAVSGTAFFPASAPASASIGIATAKRPNSILTPVTILKNRLLPRPANALPLFAFVDVNA